MSYTFLTNTGKNIENTNTEWHQNIKDNNEKVPILKLSVASADMVHIFKSGRLISPPWRDWSNQRRGSVSNASKTKAFFVADKRPVAGLSDWYSVTDPDYVRYYFKYRFIFVCYKHFIFNTSRF